MERDRWKRQAQRELLRVFNAVRSHYRMQYVSRDQCTETDLKRHYRELLLRLHPDKQSQYAEGEVATSEDFAAVQNAWEEYSRILISRGEAFEAEQNAENSGEEHINESHALSSQETVRTSDEAFRGKAVLLTWHSRRFQEEHLEVWKVFLTWKNALVSKWDIEKWSVCMERHVDKEIFDDELIVEHIEARVHLHAVFEFKAEHRLNNMKAFMFLGCVPHVAQTPAKGNQWQWSTQRQHFYVSGMKKCGSMHRETNQIPWSHYVPYKSWVDTAWTKHKIDNEEYLRLSSLLREGCSKRERDVATTSRITMNKKLKRMVKDADIVLTPMRKAFIAQPEADVFNKQFDNAMERYKVLIIRGESRCGKSMFASSLCPPAFVQLVTCNLEPDLRELDREVYKSLVLDNVNSTDFIMSHRGWLQSRNQVVKLGRSGTDCYSYDVYLWRLPIIITMDTDATFVLTPWIEENAIIIRTHGKLYSQ